MTLNDEDTGNNSLQIVPETFGMDIPSACTIVIIAGKIRKYPDKTKIHSHL